jgi:hypothetical protein
MTRVLSAIIVACAGLLGASAAQAGTHWSVGINLVVPQPAVTNGGYYVAEQPAAYYGLPAEVSYVPAPVYEAPRAYSGPQIVYVNPQPAYGSGYLAGGYRGWDNDSRWHEHQRWEHERHEREEHRWDHDEHRHDGGREERRQRD